MDAGNKIKKHAAQQCGTKSIKRGMSGSQLIRNLVIFLDFVMYVIFVSFY